MNAILDALEWRYAVKKFDPHKKLETDKLDRLKKAFNLTATSYGLQPIKMLIVQAPEVKEKLVAHSYGQRQVADASHLLVLCVEQQVDEAYIRSYFKKVKQIRGTQDEILKPFETALISEFEQYGPHKIRHWATNQAYLALGNLLTVCAYEKIDSCPMEGFRPQGYDEVLALKERGLEAVLVLPVGYRAADDPFASFKKVRRDITTSVIELN